MRLLYMLIVWQIQAIPEKPLNMLNSNNHQDRYCLSYYSSLYYYYTTYCIRPAEENDSMRIFDFENTTDPGFTFTELREKNVTIQMLLSWSATIDIAEQYQIFLNNYSNSSSDKDIRFYNCTSSWFGPTCQFTFDYQPGKLFEDIIYVLLYYKPEPTEGMKVTCYKYLHCDTLLSCLDWREICDGKRDCLDGSDENDCWQLEVNECSESEYRCHNGQCIPIEFLHDFSERPDCLDKSDEEWTREDVCAVHLGFDCEEHSCRPGQNEFSCGDGRCINEVSKCHNGRSSFLPSIFSSNITVCSIKPYDLVDYQRCLEVYSEANCTNCSTISDFHKFPLLLGHVRFMISNTENDSTKTNLPDYVCYDAKLCTHFSPPTTQFNNLTCRRFNEFEFSNANSYDNLKMLIDNIKNYFRGCLTTINKIDYCNYLTMYRCENSSKCISKHRLLDGILDCPFHDDETYNKSCSLSDIHQRFKCKDNGNEKCFAQLIVRNRKVDCKHGEDEYTIEEAFIKTHISFQTICDGILYLLPISINGQNETDETDCEHWQCNNTYSRCNDFWSCENGADEINCPSSTCPQYHHSCIFPNDTTKVSCLSIIRAGNDFEDCLGGTDEQTKYRTNKVYREGDQKFMDSYQFHCWNDTKLISIDQLCNKKQDCRYNDDEVFCNSSFYLHPILCLFTNRPLTDVENFFIKSGYHAFRTLRIFFKLYNIPTYPLGLVTNNISTAQSHPVKTHPIENSIQTNLLPDIHWWCNKGVPIRLRMNHNISTLSCLCPPNYYGDKCQYQNQRVSLTIGIRVSSDWRTTFVLLITLIDNEKEIQSHDHIEYLSIRDCREKIDIYLLYATRSKNSSKTYSVQIDAFSQNTLNYRASWIFPLRFPFLPVHRLAILLNVPFSYAAFVKQQCSPPCIHGQCLHYVNDRNAAFCYCEHGWSGAQCDAKHKCDCAPDALCISNSICLCPPARFGPRCYLAQPLCNSELCLNGGQCITDDTRYKYIFRRMCLCREGYIGDRCEYEKGPTQIDISFHSSITIPSFVLAHFITARSKENKEHNRTSVGKKIQFDQHSLTIYAPTWFNIALVQISNQYYLIILHEQNIISAHISTKIIPSHRCKSLGEVFNETFLEVHLLKRIKYYHIPCKQQSDLVCFYDDVHICLCTLDRTTNCFEFDHNVIYDCERYKYCGNNGRCFQDDFQCATSSLCACDLCYFGSRCQFSTKVSALSLDIILGYHIRLKTGINQQPIIVKIATALITIMFVVGFINSFLTFQTFRAKQTRNVGCGHYLLTLSIISMVTISIFVIKFTLLVASKIGSINNRSFLHVQCVSMDFLLRLFLSINDWLSACVAIERAVNTIQGVKFNKTKSKRIAKWMVLFVILFTSCTYIYDPIHRHVMDDEEEEQTWRLTEYSLFMQRFDRFLNLFHFSIPFAINCISALIIIIVAARVRSNSQKTKSFKEHLRELFHHHRHLLISPLILIILAVPRLIISFLSGCMKSPGDAWLFLIGYFISFVPLTLTFVVFVLPSEMYKKEFSETMRQIWHR